MKKIVLTLIVFAFISHVSAQLKVDDEGRVIFGKQAYNKAISIVDETTSIGWNPFQITYKSNQMVTLSRNNGFGMMFSPTGSILIGNLLPVTSSSYIPLEIYGCDYAGGIKVYHTKSSSYAGMSVNTATAYSYEAWNGSNRNFYVDKNGIVFSNGTPITSDIRLKNEIETIPDPIDKVLQLRGVTFHRNSLNPEEKELSEEEAYLLSKTRTPEMTFEIFRQIQEEKSRRQMGVIAQEVEKILPEVVRTREDGLKTVAYYEVVGLLIEAIKELKAEVDELKGNSSFLHSATNETGITRIADPVAIQCKLYQNVPNPFNQDTQIRFYIPENIKLAQLCIYNLQGIQIKQIRVMQRGEGSQWISGSELAAGMYLYALIVDGIEVDTKRMILTK